MNRPPEAKPLGLPADLRRRATRSRGHRLLPRAPPADPNAWRTNFHNGARNRRRHHRRGDQHSRITAAAIARGSTPSTRRFHYPAKKFFRGEWPQFTRLRRRGFPEPLTRVRGSTPGAMGWGQFVPTSIAKYAHDYDGDGKIDLWNSLPDIVASVANYCRLRLGRGQADRPARASTDGLRTIDPGGSNRVSAGTTRQLGLCKRCSTRPAPAQPGQALDDEHGRITGSPSEFLRHRVTARSPSTPWPYTSSPRPSPAGLQDSAP